MKTVIVLISLLILLNVGRAEIFFPITEVEYDLYCIVTSSYYPDLIYLGSHNAIYRSNDGALTWEKIFVIKGEDTLVNDIYLDNAGKNYRLYVATNAGLYYSKERGENFQKIFRRNAVFSILIQDENIIIGTAEGLFSAQKETFHWKKITSFPSTNKVIAIVKTREHFLIATNSGIYYSRDLKNFVRSFRSYYNEESEEKSQLLPLSLLVDHYQENRIFLGTTHGLYISNDYGKSWKKLSAPYLETASIRRMAISPKQAHLYLATDQGLYQLNLTNYTTTLLYQGITTPHVRDVAINTQGVILVATKRGLFVSSREIMLKNEIKNYYQLLGPEPTITEVQEAALRYNEVGPDKIIRWRKALKYRALLPTFSLSYDKTIYGSASSNRIIVGPRDWSVTLSWDISNLIWNSYEDDIDTRSRLNTQLRTDILDEVNRLYFERKRLKLELIQNPPSDKKLLFEQILRLEELTAALDGYTGGYFSQRLQQLQNNN